MAGGLHYMGSNGDGWEAKSGITMDPSRDGLPETSEGQSLRRQFRVHTDHGSLSKAAFPVYSTSIRSNSVRSLSLRSSSPSGSHIDKLLPPRPSLKSGDDTASGARQPIIDEIASALREWHTLMFHYLARRDYRLFHVVREHIEALHSG